MKGIGSKTPVSKSNPKLVTDKKAKKDLFSQPGEDPYLSEEETPGE